jgi:hypothetical protein
MENRPVWPGKSKWWNLFLTFPLMRHASREGVQKVSRAARKVKKISAEG